MCATGTRSPTSIRHSISASRSTTATCCASSATCSRCRAGPPRDAARPGRETSMTRGTGDRYRLAAIAIAVALGVCLVVAGALIGVQRSWLDERANATARAERVVAGLSTTLDRGVAALDRALKDVAAVVGPVLEGGHGTEWPAIQASLRLAARANPDIVRIGVADGSGILRAVSAEDGHPTGIAVDGEEFYAVHRDGRAAGLWISRPFRSRANGDSIIALSRAVRTGDGQLLGVITAVVPANRFLAEWMPGDRETTRFALVRLDGAILHGESDIPRAADVVADFLGLLGPRREGGGGSHQVELAAAGPGLFVWRLVPGAPIAVVATASEDDLWRDWLGSRRGEFAGGAVIVLLSACLGVALFLAVRRALDAETQLRRNTERRYRDAIEQMPDGILLTDRDDRVVAWNRRYVEIQPYSASVLRVGLPMRDLVAHVFACLAAKGAIGLSVDARLASRARQEGIEFTTVGGRLIDGTDHRLADGGMITVLRDVTEERRLLDQLTFSETRFRDFASTASDWFWETDVEQRYTYISHGVRAIGLHPDQLIGKPRGTFGSLLGEVAPREAERVQSVFAARAAFRDVSYTIRRFDGGELVIELAAKPLFDPEGNFLGFRGGARDVTLVRQFERQLADSERRARDYAEEGSDWMWETGPDGRFTFMSDGVRRFGLDPAAFIGASRDQLPYRVPPDAPGLLAVKAAVAGRRAFRDEVFPGELVDGRVLQISLTGWPRFGDDGAFLGFRGVGRDVAAQMRQQDELTRALVAEREMNQQQRRFIAVASHEFRTPLAVIDSAAQRIRARVERYADGETAKRLDRIRASVARMTDIIESTLSTARLDEGRIALQPRHFDLAALIREVCERQRSVSADFAIHCDLPAAAAIEGDPRLLDQVFTNLLSNAVKYSGRSRRIEIAVKVNAEQVTTTIRDFGLGISPEDRPQLFQRFYRAATAQGIAGTGIGLYLVKELVRLHGGTIEVTSELGRGSVFTITLPLRQGGADGAMGQAA
ncbi:MAG: PAS domain S-box protein [Alphaproteobacteria bacterium]|nr:PAS domain S-box protein [Alphaproteobacteria bacterium]